MPAGALTVFIVDDDGAVRDSLSLMLGLAGYRTAQFPDAESFLAAHAAEWTGCLIADLRLPGMTGLELQSELRRRGSALPVIIVTAHGDVPAARTAFLAQAVDFLEKPFDQAPLCRAIDAAFAQEAHRIRSAQRVRADAQRLDALTAREREVLDRVAHGLHAKEIGAALGISPRTVEVHKARIMAKLGARNVAELVRLAVAGSAGG
jgi:FixJ family two-component response regulator